jgi:hypothetical protein
LIERERPIAVTSNQILGGCRWFNQEQQPTEDVKEDERLDRPPGDKRATEEAVSVERGNPRIEHKAGHDAQDMR